MVTGFWEEMLGAVILNKITVEAQLDWNRLNKHSFYIQDSVFQWYRKRLVEDKNKHLS